jgi:hypothetical protein
VRVLKEPIITLLENSYCLRAFAYLVKDFDEAVSDFRMEGYLHVSAIHKLFSPDMRNNFLSWRRDSQLQF